MQYCAGKPDSKQTRGKHELPTFTLAYIFGWVFLNTVTCLLLFTKELFSSGTKKA